MNLSSKHRCRSRESRDFEIGTRDLRWRKKCRRFLVVPPSWASCKDGDWVMRAGVARVLVSEAGRPRVTSRGAYLPPPLPLCPPARDWCARYARTRTLTQEPARSDRPVGCSLFRVISGLISSDSHLHQLPPATRLPASLPCMPVMFSQRHHYRPRAMAYLRRGDH